MFNFKFQIDKKTLEICCYVAGAGAFGVFIRWLQDQMAFNEAGLAEKSAFHLVVVGYILAMAFLFLRFVDRERNRNSHLPEDFCGALKNAGKLYRILRWAAGGVICLGALLLFVSSETDGDVTLLRVLAGLGFVYGVTYPLVLAAANRPVRRQGLLCLGAVIPVAFFAFWLIVCYKRNDINSVVWAFAIEMLAVCAAMAAFFRLAGFLFDSANPWRSLFFSMFGTGACVMAIADDRYMGMQLILLGTAGLLLLSTWIMFANLQQGEIPPKVQPDDGFERL